jgi:hypothetical protein
MNRILKTFEGFNKERLGKMILLNKTYIRKKSRFEIDDTQGYSDIISDLKNYDISKFKYDQKSYGIFIYPDEGYINLYRKLLKFTDEVEDTNLHFYITVLNTNNNQIDFDNGIPSILMGTSLAYKLYKLVITNNKFISSNIFSTKEDYNLWYNLLQDEDLYGIRSNTISVLIDKKCSDNELKDILSKFSGDLEFSDDLLLRIG